MSTTLNLAHLPNLAELFRHFLAGKHLNRQTEPALWAELEEYAESYNSLFTSLGYDLRIDDRGFAWFHTSESYSQIGKTSRLFALLFMLIFDTQASTGKTLLRFTEWHITSPWLAELHQKQSDLLDAEEIGVPELTDLLNKAANLGFAFADNGGWYLLPAVCRYLDHFESLARTEMPEDDLADDEAFVNPPANDIVEDAS